MISLLARRASSSLHLLLLRSPLFLQVASAANFSKHFGNSFSEKLDILNEMSSIVHQNSSVTYNDSRNCGNVIASNNTETNNYSIYVSDERQQVLEWLSPLASRERHRDVRDARVDGVGNWLLRTRMFSAWHVSKDRTTKPVLLCYGDPGVGKTYFRYELP